MTNAEVCLIKATQDRRSTRIPLPVRLSHHTAAGGIKKNEKGVQKIDTLGGSVRQKNQMKMSGVKRHSPMSHVIKTYVCYFCGLTIFFVPEMDDVVMIMEYPGDEKGMQIIDTLTSVRAR